MTQQGSVFPSPTRPRLRAPECMLVREELGVEVAQAQPLALPLSCCLSTPLPSLPRKGGGNKNANMRP